MTEIEKALAHLEIACMRRVSTRNGHRAALRAAITRREAEVRREAINECAMVVDAIEAASDDWLDPLTEAANEIRALIKEQP